MKEILDLISQYGFPMIVSAFFLLKLDKTLLSLNNSLTELIILIQNLKK